VMRQIVVQKQKRRPRKATPLQARKKCSRIK
jgi:hypothetical protein